MKTDYINFVDYNEVFLDRSWIWLKDKEVKELTNTPDFTKEQQLEFYNSLNGKEDYYIKGIQYDKISIGACGLKKITSDDAEYWGYIGEKEYWGRGLGKEILKYSIKKAREFKLSSIYLYVIKTNLRAIKLYEKFGFMTEEETDQQFKMRLQL